MKAILVVLTMFVTSIVGVATNASVVPREVSTTGVTVTIAPEPNDSCTTNVCTVWMGALFQGQWYLRDTNNNWQPYNGGPFPVAGQGSLAGGPVVLTVFAGVDISGLKGLEFYVGYGVSEFELLNTIGHLALVYTVPLSQPVIPPPTEHIFDPALTDPLISGGKVFGFHYAYTNSAVSAKGKLFLFFAASNGTPSQYQLIEKAAASNGYNSLGLAYPNADVVANLCLGTTDPNCEGEIRAETLTGTPSSPLVSVDVSNSVNNRLAKALTYLNATYPDEGWGKYVSGGAIQWNQIRVSGHSQGGGVAAYAATQNTVDRVCTFSSPADFNTFLNAPAPWLSATSATPSSSYYGFGHMQDPIVPWGHLQQIWGALGMAAPTVNVDSVAWPYSNSHMLYTNLASTGSLQSLHSLPVTDAVTPLDSSGVPVYLPVWLYACF